MKDIGYAYQEHPTIPMTELKPFGASNNQNGGPVLWFYRDNMTIYRYIVYAQRWEQVRFVPNANPYSENGCMECDGNCD